MARIKYNHSIRILNTQPSTFSVVRPGTIIRFGYRGQKISDKKPLVMCIWNDWDGEEKIHGINLNYLKEYDIKVITQKIMDGSLENTIFDDNFLVLEDQDSSKFDDNLPYRNILTEPYTRFKLPTFKEVRRGNPLSFLEAKSQIKNLYKNTLKSLNVKYDVYRTYHIAKITALRAVTYDIKGLLK